MTLSKNIFIIILVTIFSNSALAQSLDEHFNQQQVIKIYPVLHQNHQITASNDNALRICQSLGMNRFVSYEAFPCEISEQPLLTINSNLMFVKTLRCREASPNMIFKQLQCAQSTYK